MKKNQESTRLHDSLDHADHNPIRVLHVVENLGLAGLEYGIIKQVNRLDPVIFSPMICCLRFQMNETRALIDDRIPVFQLKKKRGRDLTVIFHLAELLRSQKVGIVHSHNWATFFYTLVASRIARTPVLVHGEHGREESTVPRSRQLIQSLMGRWVDTFVTVSSNLGKELVENFKVQPEKLVTIPNGVNQGSFQQTFELESIRLELNLKSDNLVILTVGGLRPVKDHDTLIKAFSRVQKEYPKARLLVVGTDYGKGYQQKLQGLCQTLQLSNSVQFVGIRHDIPQLMQLCKVYVNTSLFEGMSNTILEAMASGRPVVATRVGGNPELVVDRVTGYLVESKDDLQLSECLKTLLLNSTLARNMGEAGQKRVAQHHSMRGMIKRIETHYREVWWRKGQSKNPLNTSGKQLVSRGIRWTGINLLKSVISSSGLRILTYHRVLPVQEVSSYPFPGMVMARDLFEAQIAYLAKSYVVLDLKEAIRQLREGQLPKNAVVITFDDGYRDNYEFAWPILQKYNVSATFFVVTGALDQKAPFWWDVIGDSLKHLSINKHFNKREGEQLPNWVWEKLSQLTKGERYQRVANDLVHSMNDVPLEERRAIQSSLERLANKESNSMKDLTLSWGQVKEMYQSGMKFAAHSHTHAFMDELSELEAQREIEECVWTLQKQLQSPVRFFSYPRGRYSDNLRPLLKNAGIEAAVTTNPGKNFSSTDLFNLKRFDAGYGTTPAGFDKNIFEIELNGWLSPLRK